MPILPAPEKPKSLPIHRWGNGFELHGLPELPAKGVVGLLGGFGKTTTLMILAGKLDPSCGWYALLKKCEPSSVAARPRYDILKKLDADELDVSYKPQAVEMLRHLPDLHRNLSDLKLDAKLVDSLKLPGHDVKNLEQLNSSELQRVAIAAALSKDAEIYLLDEPSEHLDMAERAKVAEILRERGKRMLIVVADSDLAFLAKACDSISIFYGSETWSSPSRLYAPTYALKAFLEGVLAKEKMRIRPRMKPGETPAQREKRKSKTHELLFDLSGVQKRFGGNALLLNGEIMRNERIGVVGSRGSGKSSLLKIVAGLDEVKPSGTAAVAYKPQHLPQKDVLDGLSKELIKYFGIPLRGRPRLTASLRQRISIARCLNADADFYVLDQPSDGLRAEERLAVAELLKSKPCVIVADNDAWLVAHVADRCGLVVREDGKSRVEWSSNAKAIEKAAKG